MNYEEREDSVFPQIPNEGSRKNGESVRVKVFKQCTKKFERQQVSTIDPDTCTLIDEEKMRCHFGVLFTTVTQHHIGRPARSLCLFTETSYKSRLGACVPTSPRSSTQRLTSNISHRCLVMEGGHMRWAPDAPTRELVSL